MTLPDLSELLADYAAGLEAEISLLQHVQRVSVAQREAGAQHDFERLNGIADERERLMGALVRLEHDLRPLRRTILDNRELAATAAQYALVVTLHREAADLVSSILAGDGSTVEALREAEAARRAVARALETGESTLAAYRRILTPASVGPALVERRG